MYTNTCDALQIDGAHWFIRALRSPDENWENIVNRKASWSYRLVSRWSRLGRLVFTYQILLVSLVIEDSSSCVYLTDFWRSKKTPIVDWEGVSDEDANHEMAGWGGETRPHQTFPNETGSTRETLCGIDFGCIFIIEGAVVLWLPPPPPSSSVDLLTTSRRRINAFDAFVFGSARRLSVSCC